jgi:dipeptidyl aminopeptidase/acylaminoacyl peptidase
MKLLLLFVATLFFLTVSTAEAADGKRSMKIDDLFRFQRLADPQISPDGKQVAYVVTTVDLAANKSTAALWLAPTDKGEPRQLTNPGPGKKDRHPRWSPDGQRLLFESNRSGENQLWLIDLAGGEAQQLTSIATDASNAIWSPDGKTIAFVSAVWPEFSDKPYKESNELNKKRKEEREKGPVKAKVFTKLFFRHWDDYVDDKRQHLFVIPAPGALGAGSMAEPKDVTPGDRDAYPTSTTFSVGDDFTFSPDGKYLVFTAVPEREEAWSTNYDICRVPVQAEASGGRKPPECLTGDNKAADGAPRFSPDGKHLAYRAQKRAGSEADRWEILIVATDSGGTFQGKPKALSLGEWDLSVGEFTWAGNNLIAFTADYQGKTPVFIANTEKLGVGLGLVEDKEGQCSAVTYSRDFRTVTFLMARMSHPPEVFTRVEEPPGRQTFQLRNLSRANTKLLAELDLPRPESVSVEGAGGAPMQMWLLKPPGFDAKKKWPVIYLVHGGPQGAWEDGWSFRWNPELWAAQGYVVAMPNPRGSTGFGQKYVDDISGDWGGKCYEDLMKGAEYLEKLPYVDKERIASAGGSFGGYMMNWFAVNTNKFKCLVTHCSVWNFESMYATTEELWFDEWEHGGPPWGPNRKSYEKHSPHRLAGNLAKFKTPMLVIHNDLDFRCPIGQGHELFTTLQRLGVPSRMVNFPDEGHWVLKPANSKYWHEEVFAWLAKYCPPGGK